MARVVDGGFAQRESEMITLAALLSTSQMLENSVPNSSVLITQHTDSNYGNRQYVERKTGLRFCCMRIEIQGQ